MEFLASDPIRYAFDESSVTVPEADISGGLLVPADVPALVGVSGDSGLRVANNVGDYETWPTLEITAPAGATNPRIENVTTGDILRLDIALAAGDVLTITTNPRRRSVLLNGSTDRYNAVDPTSSFFALQPGGNTLRYSATGAGGSTLVASWRAAY